MKQLSYAEKLSSPMWQKKRLEIFNRDNFTCRLCGDSEIQLHIHHTEYQAGKEPWECDNQFLVTLCKDCHSEIESMKKWAKEVSFKDIRIEKIKGHRIGRIMFVQAKYDKLFLVYDENETCVCANSISKEDTKRLQKFLKFEYRG